MHEDAEAGRNEVPSGEEPKLFIEASSEAQEDEIMAVFTAMGKEVIRLRRQRDPKGSPVRTYTLGSREVEVLSHVTEGKTNAEIGVIMHISSATVKCHMERIMLKMKVSNRTAAASQALRHGLLD